MAQLINIADGYHLWSERYDRQIEDVFDIQDEISQAIADALRIRLVSDAAVPKVSRYTDDLDAYHLYLQGRHLWFNRPTGWAGKALRCYEQAIEQDPSYPLGHAGAAAVHVVIGYYGFLPPKVAFSRARASVDRALAGGPDVAGTHVSLGMLRLLFDWDWDAAEDAFTQATNLDATDGVAHGWRGLSLVCTGRTAEARREAFIAQELDPVSPYASTLLAGVLYFGRQHREAREQALKVLDRAPEFLFARWTCSGACDALSMHEEAIAHAEHAVAIVERAPFYLGLLGQAYAHGGQRAEAEAILEELRTRFDREYVPPVTLALVSMALGETGPAFECLEQDNRDRGVLLWTAYAATWFDDFRSDPRFQALLRRMNFPETAGSG